MSLITNGDLSQLHLSRAVTEGLCAASPCPNTARHHEMALQLQQRFSRAQDVSVRGCQREAGTGSSVRGALGANDDAVHPGLEIAVLFSFP